VEELAVVASIGPPIRREFARWIPAAIAHACLEASSLEVSVVVGGVSGAERAPVMTQHGVDVFIGDHPLDMLGAAHADVPRLDVTTGAHDKAALYAAEATEVVAGLDIVATCAHLELP
jgi:hypothetical protein